MLRTVLKVAVIAMSLALAGSVVVLAWLMVQQWRMGH